MSTFSGGFVPPLSVAPEKGLSDEALSKARQQGLLPKDVSIPSNFSNQAISKSYWVKGATYTPISYVTAEGETVSYYLTDNNDRIVPGNVFRGENKDYGLENDLELIEELTPAIVRSDTQHNYQPVYNPFGFGESKKEPLLKRADVLAAEGLTQEELELDSQLRGLGEHGGLFLTRARLNERLSQNQLFGRRVKVPYYKSEAEENAAADRHLYRHVDAKNFSDEPMDMIRGQETTQKIQVKVPVQNCDSTKSPLWTYKEPIYEALAPRLMTHDYEVLTSGVDGFELMRSTGRKFVAY